MTYLEKMNQIIENKKAKGMVGIKFCVLPESKKASEDYELMAKAFCLLDEMDQDGTLAKTTKEII